LAKTCDPLTGGLGRHVYELSSRLAKKGNDVTVVVLKGGGTDIQGVDVVELDFFDLGHSVLNMYGAVPFYLNFLRKNADSFDVVHGHEIIGFPGLLESKVEDFNFVYTAHGVASDHVSRSYLRPVAKLVHLPDKLNLKYADKVIAVSDNTKEQLLSDYGLDERKVCRIYNGVDTQKFVNSCEFGNRIVFVGYLVERKGPQIVLEVFKKIENSFDDLELVIVGDGRLKAELVRNVKDNGLEDRVFFENDISDEELIDLYSSSIFVMPSSYEGQGIVYVEAMSCGAPVIGCDNSAIPEMIEDGVNGFLIDRNSAELADALSKILEDEELRERMSSNAMRTSDKFDWNNIVDDTARLYSELVK